MNRSTRTLIVVALATGLAGVATFLVYRTIQSRPTKEIEIARAFAVVASHPITLGTMLTPNDVKVVPWPAANQVPGGFSKIEDVVNRGVISPVAENEPLTANNLAGKDSGAGLPPTIPTGMRAISVRVNEVIGVAGFVVPGTRVDVMAIINQAQGNSLARVVVSNVQVLAAGTRYDQDLAREGKALPSSVVTLLVTPEDAQLVGLAANQGQILLTLRNPLDTTSTSIPGSRTANLSGGSVPAPVPAASDAPAPAPRPRRAATPPPSPPPAPEVKKPTSVTFIRGAKQTEEIIKKEEPLKKGDGSIK